MVGFTVPRPIMSSAHLIIPAVLRHIFGSRPHLDSSCSRYVSYIYLFYLMFSFIPSPGACKYKGEFYYSACFVFFFFFAHLLTTNLTNLGPNYNLFDNHVFLLQLSFQFTWVQSMLPCCYFELIAGHCPSFLCSWASLYTNLTILRGYSLRLRIQRDVSENLG